MKCPKCSAISGDDWRQCRGSCPMTGSPHYVADEPFRMPGKKVRPLLEKDIEASHVADTKSNGGIEYKFTSPARRSVPDRLRLMPIAPEHREIVARYVRFREYKKTGEKATPSQQREHDYLRSLGFTVDVVDQPKEKQ